MITLLKKFADMIFLLRLPLLAPVWTVLILGWIVGNPNVKIGEFEYGVLFINLLGFSFLVASIYVVNQIQDIESDRINKKLFLLPQGIISIPAAWTLAIICAAAGLAIAWTQGVWMFTLFALGLIIGILYNLPPASLKNHAVGGMTANSLGHGAITFLVGWLSAKNGQAVDIDLLIPGLLSSLAPAFANGAVFLATTIPDAAGDKLTGKKTFCVAYGEKATAVAAAVMCAFAMGTSFLLEHHYWVMAVPAVLSLGIFINFAVTAKRDSAFYSFKWPVFLLSAVVTLFVPVYGVLIFVTFAAGRIYYKLRFGIIYPTFRPK
ncbi:MAG: UbiA family prenyltransferase [Chitinispirillia bacterium]|nr:UbiA family prenyltransferase [Chitinispirillia bacterium]MCL2242303.1 UbiA family prenyltransferase [Chitinispirillia bacterium]